MQAGVHVPGGGAAGRGTAQPAPGLQQTLHHLGRGQPPHHAARLRQVGGIVSGIRIIVIRIIVIANAILIVVIINIIIEIVILSFKSLSLTIIAFLLE